MTDHAHTRYFEGVTFRPSLRAETEEAELNARLAKITRRAEELAAMSGAAVLAPEALDRLLVRHRQKTLAYWSSIGRCMSPMIAGPARFPVERNRKRLAITDRRLAELLADQAGAISQLERSAFPHGLPGSPIRGDDPEAIEKLTARISEVRQSWALTKSLAALARKGDWLAVAELTSPSVAASARRTTEQGLRAFGVAGFGPEVKRLEARLTELVSRKERGSTERVVAGIRLVENVEADRIQLIFASRPSADDRALLSDRGFRWTPSANAWQRHLNNAGRHAASVVLAKLAEAA